MLNTVHVTRPETATTLWVLGDQVRFMGRLEGSDLHVLDVVVPPGSGTPPHRHASVEIFRVNEGEITFGFFGEGLPQSIVAGPGTVVTVPSNVGHNYRNNGDTPAEMTSIIETQMVDFFCDIGTPVAPPPGPPPAAVIDQVMAACGRHGIAVLGGP
jgi:quercetin dioxygenase-like cupin family protein